MSTGAWIAIITGLMLSVCIATILIITCCFKKEGGRVNNEMGEALQAEDE